MNEDFGAPMTGNGAVPGMGSAVPPSASSIGSGDVWSNTIKVKRRRTKKKTKKTNEEFYPSLSLDEESINPYDKLGVSMAKKMKVPVYFKKGKKGTVKQKRVSESLFIPIDEVKLDMLLMDLLHGVANIMVIKDGVQYEEALSFVKKFKYDIAKMASIDKLLTNPNTVYNVIQAAYNGTEMFSLYLSAKLGVFTFVEIAMDNGFIDPSTTYGTGIIRYCLRWGNIELAKRLIEDDRFKQVGVNTLDVVPASFHNMDSLKFVLSHPKIKKPASRLNAYIRNDMAFGGNHVLTHDMLDYLQDYISKNS